MNDGDMFTSAVAHVDINLDPTITSVTNGSVIEDANAGRQSGDNLVLNPGFKSFTSGVLRFHVLVPARWIFPGDRLAPASGASAFLMASGTSISRTINTIAGERYQLPDTGYDPYNCPDRCPAREGGTAWRCKRSLLRSSSYSYYDASKSRRAPAPRPQLTFSAYWGEWCGLDDVSLP